MKKLLIFLLMVQIYVFGCMQPNTVKKQEMKPMKIYVATDLHYLSKDLTDLGTFFTSMIENADGKVMRYSEELIDAFINEMMDKKPEVLILSGDLTFNGECLSHIQLAKKLKQLKEIGTTILVIPGNHDLYSTNAAKFIDDTYEIVEGITSEQFASIYAAYGFEQAIAKDINSLSYVVEVNDSLRIMMIDTNTKDHENKVKEETLQWIEKELQDAQNKGKHVITVSHQNLINHSSLLSEGFTISNADKLKKLLQKYSVICHLSGHIHMQHISSQDNLYDIATSSLAISPNQYGILDIDSEAMHYETQSVDVSTWTKKSQIQDENLLHFKDYAKTFFETTSYKQAYKKINTKEDANLFASINTKYFAGRLDTLTDEEKDYIWPIQDDFINFYLQSILKESGKNSCEVEISLYSYE